MFPIHIKLTVGTHAELARLTAFLEQNTAANVASAPIVSADEKAAVLAKPTAAPGKPKPAATPAATEPTAPASDASSKSSEPASPTTPPAAAPVAYPDLQKAVLTLHKMDPAAAVPIAKSLGADTFKLLPEGKWAEALRQVNEAIDQRKAA